MEDKKVLISNKFIVWDLFGGQNNSLHNALAGDKRFDIYTFDINDTYETTHIIDLSQPIDKLIEYFDKFPKPDIIVASPLCQSFSLASAMEKGNACWVVDKKTNTIREREREDYINTRYEYEVQHAKAELGRKCLKNTMDLIDHYNPKAYYIENPLNSLMFYVLSDWRPLDLMIGFNYGDYGFEVKKPTRLKTNVNMNLKPRNERKKYTKLLSTLSFVDRSKVPAELLQQVFNSFYNYLNM